MSEPTLQSVPETSAWPDRLAAALLATLPLAMWVQSRSAVLILSLAAAAALAGRLKDGHARTLGLAMLRSILQPAGVLLTLFMVWALTTLLWSHRPIAGLRDWGELLLPIIAGLVLIHAFVPHAPRWTLRAVAAAVLLASLLTFLELWLGMGWREAAGLRAQTFVFNRTIICLLVLLVPVLAVFALPAVSWPEAGRDRIRMMLTAALAAAGFGLCLLYTESGAVRLGALVAVLAASAALLAPRITRAAFAAGLVGLVLLAPVQGEIADRLIPAHLHEVMKESHSRDRIDIWLAFGELARQRPLTGAGFGTGASASNHPFAAPIEGRRRILLDVGHPHSLQVQAWAETGLVGAALLGLAGLAALAGLGRMPRRLQALALATAAGALAIAAVGHGAWQGWWIASLAASSTLFALANRGGGHDLAARATASPHSGTDPS